MQGTNRHPVCGTQYCRRWSSRPQQRAHQKMAILFRRLRVQHRLLRETGRSQCTPPTGRSMVREHVLFRRVDQSDMAVSKANQSLDRCCEGSVAIEIQIREGVADLTAPMRHEWHAPFEQVTDTRIVATRARQQDPIDPMVFHQMAIRVHLRIARRRTHQHEVQSGVRQKRADRTQHRQEELIEGALLGRDDEADGAAAAGAQSPSHLIGPIARPRRLALDAFTGCRRHVGISRQSARNGGDRQPQLARQATD